MRRRQDDGMSDSPHMATIEYVSYMARKAGKQRGIPIPH